MSRRGLTDDERLSITSLAMSMNVFDFSENVARRACALNHQWNIGALEEAIEIVRRAWEGPSPHLPDGEGVEKGFDESEDDEAFT